MNEDGFIAGRMSEWRSAVAEAEAVLSKDRGGVEGVFVRQALEASGQLLRRLGRAGAVAKDVERLLRALPAAAVQSAAASADVALLPTRLRRAMDEAVEAALPESPGEGETWASWAMAGLDARDDLEGLLFAMGAREAMGLDGDRRIRERLEAALKAQDDALAPRSRRLIGLNPWRRAMRDGLDPEHRDAAWWYSARAECDELLAALAGQEAGEHVDGCDACRMDLEAVRPLDWPRARHLSEDDLWNYDLGLMPSGERVYADEHARTCAECARALGALQEGEAAIAELTGGALPAVVEAPARGGMAARMRRGGFGEPEVVAEDADFRLLLFRRTGRVRVVVQPNRTGRVAAASLEVGGRVLQASPTAEGLEIELDASGAAETPAGMIRVRLAGSAGEVTHAVDLGLPPT